MAFFNDSKFCMWRACIGIVWLDGKVTSEESQWVLDKVSNLAFTQEQRSILQKDLEQNLDMKSVLSGITDKKDRAFLSHQIRVISHLDHDFSTIEKETLKKWNDLVLKGIDFDELNEEVEQIEKSYFSENHVYKNYNKNSIFEAAVNHFKKITNKGDYKYPKDSE